MCGIFGIWHPQAQTFLFDGLYAMQHRGKESAGAAIITKDGVENYTSMGFVNDLFKKYPNLRETQTHAAIGHIRYSTSGKSCIENAQPLLRQTKYGDIAIVHNGTIPKAKELKTDFLNKGGFLAGDLDTEIFLRVVVESNKKTLNDALIEAVEKIDCAYSFLILSENALYAIRDRYGFWGLSIGKKESGYVFASEAVALDKINASYVSEVEPGAIFKIFNHNGNIETRLIRTKSSVKKSSRCVFDMIYLSNPASTNTETGCSVYTLRKKLGIKLAEEFMSKNIKIDIVVPVPDSGNISALGFHKISNIPLEFALIRGHYTNRTFIDPSQEERSVGVRRKFDPVYDIINGKKIGLVDDSLVRGTTSKKLARMLKKCGASEIHLLIASPPIKFPCHYGIDMKTKEELIASKNSIDEIIKIIGADSLTFLSMDSFNDVFNKNNFCNGCFSEKYPTQL